MTGKYDISFLFYLPVYLAVATTPIRYVNTHPYYIYLPVYLKVPIPTRYDNTNLHEYLTVPIRIRYHTYNTYLPGSLAVPTPIRYKNTYPYYTYLPTQSQQVDNQILMCSY